MAPGLYYASALRWPVPAIPYNPRPPGIVVRDALGGAEAGGGSRTAGHGAGNSICWEGPPLLAASRTSSATSEAIANRTISRRVSFARIDEPLEVPDLLGLQTESFDWLLGNEKWQARVAAALEAGRQDVPETAGLEEIFEEISPPIEDFGGTMSLSFREHRFEPPKYTADECKEKDFTYAAPLFVTAEFVNYTTGEIKSQTVFMGDFPLMSDRGTFIINGTERVVVSQLVRSPPGVYFERTPPDKTSDKDVFTVKVIPSRGAWLEFEIDKRDNVGVRVDRKRKQNATVLLKALGMTESEIRESSRSSPPPSSTPWRRTTSRPRTRRCSTCTARSARASRRPSRPAAR